MNNFLTINLAKRDRGGKKRRREGEEDQLRFGVLI